MTSMSSSHVIAAFLVVCASALKKEHNHIQVTTNNDSLPCSNRNPVDVKPGSRFTLESPGFPQLSNRFVCDWVFRIRAGTKATINFNVFQVPCKKSKLEIYFQDRNPLFDCTRRPQRDRRIQLPYKDDEDYLTLVVFRPRRSNVARISSTIVGKADNETEVTEPNSDDCGITRNSRIINGELADRNEYPFMAYLSMADLYQCGGTLISSRTVLTAAHCVDEVSASDVKVQLGCNRINECRFRRITEITLHDAYDRISLNNDIALLRLKNKIESFDDKIRPVCLPSRRDRNLQGNEEAFVAGWGKVHTNGHGSADLKEATVKAISDDQCSRTYGRVSSSVQCVVDKSGATCQGDSGGFLGKIVNGRWTQFGVTSFGNEQGCHLGSPMGFTETTNDNDEKLADWIANNI